MSRYMYYTDWGSKPSVVRTLLNGSNPLVITTALNNPNGIAILNGIIYIADSNYKTGASGTIYSMTAQGSSFTNILQGSNIQLKVFMSVFQCRMNSFLLNFNMFLRGNAKLGNYFPLRSHSLLSLHSSDEMTFSY